MMEAPSEVSSGKTFEIGPREILTYAWQTAKGMNYLAGMKVINLCSVVQILGCPFCLLFMYLSGQVSSVGKAS